MIVVVKNIFDKIFYENRSVKKYVSHSPLMMLSWGGGGDVNIMQLIQTPKRIPHFKLRNIVYVRAS